MNDIQNNGVSVSKQTVRFYKSKQQAVKNAAQSIIALN